MATKVNIHETCIIDNEVQIGENVTIAQFSSIMDASCIGKGTCIGQNVSIESNVRLGNNCNIQNNVHLISGVNCKDNVYIGASVIFTNVFYAHLRKSVNNKRESEKTTIEKGVTIGANCTIISGVTIGDFAFIAAGSLISNDVKAYALVSGNPAKQIGWVSEFGHRLVFDDNGDAICPQSKQEYKLVNNTVNRIK